MLEIEDAKIIFKEALETKGGSVIAKMNQLVHLGVDTLICGAIDRNSMHYLSLNRIRIYSWVTGEVDDAVACFLNNNMRPGIMIGERGKMKGRWQFCKGRNHLCDRFQTDFYNDEKGVNTVPRGDGTGPKEEAPRSKGREDCQADKGGRGSGLGKGRGKGQGRVQRQGQGQGQGNRRQSK